MLFDQNKIGKGAFSNSEIALFEKMIDSSRFKIRIFSSLNPPDLMAVKRFKELIVTLETAIQSN